METNNYAWTKFYTDFADALLVYEHDRKTLLQRLLNVYKTLDMKFPKLEQDDSVIDIDPFTVFGLFNKGITRENRCRIIAALAKEFNVAISFNSEITLDGVPVLNNLKAVFFSWTRKATDIDNLWALFRIALNYADAKDKTELKYKFVVAYNKVIKQDCIKWNITMGLYWIRPYSFINLDSRNRWYICRRTSLLAKEEKVLSKVPDAETYLYLSEIIVSKLGQSNYSFKTLPELSCVAFTTSNIDNEEEKRERENESALIDEDANAVHYWLYSAGHNGEKWEEYYKQGLVAIGWGELGDLSLYESKDKIKRQMKVVYGGDRSYRNDAHAVWQFSKEMKVGDIIFVKKGMYQIVGRGVVESDYIYDESQPGNYDNLRKVKWTHCGEWSHPGQAVLKTLTDITPYTEYVAKLNALFEAEQGEEFEEKEIEYPAYTADDFLRDVYMSDKDYTTLVNLLVEKKNIILQGAPGVGKTYAARRLAYSMMGEQNSERVMMVQFHQSYSYEDFIMGYRPKESGGFNLRQGPFYQFCKKAESDNENDYFFIIDEINRGNISKIFGELFVLIERDKRSKVKLQLLYSDEKFSVPENVYIIGMMNTADRSLAMLDYALRRRFAFFELKPGFETPQFINQRNEVGNAKFDKLIGAVQRLNEVIANDETLGEGFQIGHSYFCIFENVNDNRLSNIVEYELIPMLKEYWFDEPTKVREWSAILRSAIK